MRIFNKRAKFNYKLENERIEAGISLTGGEAKAVRTGHLDLTNSFAKIVGGEVFLINANIPVLGAKYAPTRTRKLLLHRKEIISILSKMRQKKLTLVPIKMYTKDRLIKLELALGKSKRKFEKKEAIKKKDLIREVEKEFQGKL
jgi:SsrA-binding protein